MDAIEVQTETTQPPASGEVSTSAPAPTTEPKTETKPVEHKEEKHALKATGDFNVTNVTVGEPEIRGGALTKHHVYKITATPNSGVDHVFRRYRDFDWLRSVLAKTFPGVFIPPLPPKKIIGNQDDSFVHERRFDIERCLNRICQVPALATSIPFQVFYRGHKLSRMP